ncbi:MAG: phosphoribosylanthranilate isomerase [Chloroflexi bacterium]|nr:phosphoribosylanthranilate isomerase [Chloroflexota bacterium]
MPTVKICGITNVDDARCAVAAGADMLGFIFYRKSPRYVTPEDVRTIVREIRTSRPTIVTVGVFVNESTAHILHVLDTAGLDLAQLSGDEPPEHVHALNGRAYKAVRRADETSLLPYVIRLSSSSNPKAPDVLLDADHPTLYGGSGMRADTSLAAILARQYRLLLAGGLTPTNVSAAIRAAKPWGVDVASGVEATPGRKDHDKVRAFVAAVRDT